MALTAIAASRYLELLGRNHAGLYLEGASEAPQYWEYWESFHRPLLRNP